MKILIVEPFITGHYLEYLNHIYKMTLDMPDDEFVFVLPISFSKARSMFEWPKNKKVTFDLSLPAKDRIGGKLSLLGSLKKSIGTVQLYKQYCKKYKPDGIFCVDIMTMVPFLPLLVYDKIKVIGIVYDIYLRIEKLPLRTLVANMARYFVLSKSKLFHRVFILNDRRSADSLNQKFHTHKFSYLPDPFVPINTQGFDYREEYGIISEKMVFAHFGSLTRRKGTIDILSEIKSISKDKLSNYVFVFAGRVNQEIKEEFYSFASQIKYDTTIIVKDEFCDFDYISSLCRAANAILIPYRDTCKSSGLIGYASQFSVPVVTYSSGLLGELVRKYKLGLEIESITELPEALERIKEGDCIKPSNEYCLDNQVANFQKMIKEAFLSK